MARPSGVSEAVLLRVCICTGLLEKNGTECLSSTGGPSLGCWLPASRDQPPTACPAPFPFPGHISKHRPQTWLSSRRVGEAPRGGLFWRLHSLGLPRKADNAFLPSRASPAHFPGRQAGRKHILTECPMQAGTFALVSLYPQRIIAPISQRRRLRLQKRP